MSLTDWVLKLSPNSIEVREEHSENMLCMLVADWVLKLLKSRVVREEQLWNI